MPSVTKSKDAESGGSRFRQKIGEKIIAFGNMISGVKEARGIEMEGKSFRLIRGSGSVRAKSGDAAPSTATSGEKHHRRKRTHHRHGDGAEVEAGSQIVEEEQTIFSLRSYRASRSSKDRGVKFDVRPITPTSEVGSQQPSLFLSTKDSMEEVKRKDAEDRLRLEEQRRREEDRLAREKQQEQERLLQAQERAIKLQRRKQEEEQKGRENSRRRGRDEGRIRQEEAAPIQQNERKQKEVERQRHLKAVRFQEEQEGQKQKSQSVFPTGLTSFFFKSSEDDKEKEEENKEELNNDRCIGDMQRTVLEGMVPMTKDEVRRKKSRESGKLTARNLAKNRADRGDDSEGLDDDRCIGDMQRTYIEGMCMPSGRG